MSKLDPFALMIKRHWKQYRPKMSAELEKEGKLDELCDRAADRAIEIEVQAFRHGLTPEQADELARETWLLPDEEDEPQLVPDPNAWLEEPEETPTTEPPTERLTVPQEPSPPEAQPTFRLTDEEKTRVEHLKAQIRRFFQEQTRQDDNTDLSRPQER